MSQDQDNDFDFENKDEKIPGADNTKQFDNQHFDEAIDIEGDDVPSEDEDRADMQRQEMQEKQRQQKLEDVEQNDEEYDEDNPKNQEIPGAYNPEEYENLQVDSDVKDLFKYITRYKPTNLQLDSKLKPFIPDYFPAIGEVDAFLKMDVPDKGEENLGIQILDEPCLNMSKEAVMKIQLADTLIGGDSKPIDVHSIQNAEKNPRLVQAWINDVSKIRENKSQPSVPYSKPMPNIDDLMQVWPAEVEQVLNQVQLPTEELDISTEEFARLLCSVVDIPIHETNNEKSLIEALHVAFTLYAELKANQGLLQHD